MTEGGQTVCLCMIVRNEAHVIERCLESVRPFIDAYAICDTGSHDGTAEVIEQYLDEITGFVSSREWVDFAHNRNVALELAERTGCNFALIIDADDWLTAPPGYRLPDLTQDVYDLRVEHGSITYSRPQLVRLGRGCRWRGVLHEFLEVPPELTRGTLPLVVQYGGDGARSRDSGKYTRDAHVLEEALKRDDDPDLRNRYAFYLSQSYRDAGELEEAFQAYIHRASCGGWLEEVYVSLLNAGTLARKLGLVDWQVVDCFTRAAGALPDRVEAQTRLAGLLRERERHAEAYAMLNGWRNTRGCPWIPQGTLFAEPWAYRYGFWDELSIAAYWTGNYSISLDAALQALKGDPPQEDRERIIKNAEFALRKL